MFIDLELKNYRGFSDEHPARMQIGPGFTALVGANNSGKSSLLRFLYDYRPLFEWLQEPQRMEMLGSGEQFSYGLPDRSTEALYHNGNERSLSFELVMRSGNTPTREVRLRISHARNSRILVKHVPNGAEQGLGPKVTYPDSDLDELLSALRDTMYVGAFRNVLNFTPSAGGYGLDNPVYFDLRAGRQFVEWWRDWKNGRDRAGNERAFRLTNDLARIFDLDGLEINGTPSGNEIQLFVNGKSFRLDELGSGVTQFLLVLANAAHRRPAWILIDEPELSLHPALQLEFLTTLASYARIGVVFATHSVGLARSVAERIYACSRMPSGAHHVTRFEAVRSLPEFLGELSFSTTRELGFDTVLLVEGATEVPLLQQLLRRVGKDRNVVLLPLGGSGTINANSSAQLSEVTRIASNVAALIDSERVAAGASLAHEREAFVRNCAKLGIDCHVLERRAMENYLPARAIQKVKGEQYRALEHFELLKDLPLGWSKSDNWRIMAEARKEELVGTDLFDFISRL